MKYQVHAVGKFVLIIIGVSGICNAQIQFSIFNDLHHYTEEDGLASTFLFGVQEYKYGFLWLATGKGVSRYEGNHYILQVGNTFTG